MGQVGVRVRNSGRGDNHWCGATIISEHFILTAAHCMEDFPKGLYVLRVGDYNTEVFIRILTLRKIIFKKYLKLLCFSIG